MKTYIRIGGALTLGTFIILIALSVQRSANTEALAGEIIVTQEPNRTYIEAGDKNGDGIKDWEEDLRTGVFDAVETPTSSTTDAEPYIAPTTFTGKFSEAFFKDYMDGKMKGADFSDPTAFVGKAVDAIDANTQSKHHSRLELTVIPDSEDAIHNYGNRVSEIIKSNSIKNENEASILQKALLANDPTLLDSLAPIRTVYVNTIDAALRAEVPESLITVHLNFINACESILADIEAMQLAFTDPLYSLARVKGYDADAKTLFNSLQEISKSLAGSGAVYTSDEPGALFYLFES